ncbi:MAG: hypothetical protein H6Q70_4320 [Firmicutes bacterium]|nr:hypothetical protein [Bacillota bacterium]
MHKIISQDHLQVLLLLAKGTLQLNFVISLLCQAYAHISYLILCDGLIDCAYFLLLFLLDKTILLVLFSFAAVCASSSPFL